MVAQPILFVNSNWKPALAALESRYTVFNDRDAADRPALLARAAPVVHALFTNEGSWKPALMDALPALELIVLVSNGYENVDLAKARARGIRVTNAPDETTGDVADPTDPTAMAAALREGRIGGAGPDIYAQEPADPAPFAGLDNVVLTPHFSSGTDDTRRAMNETGLRNLEAFFAGQPLPTLVPELRDTNPEGR
jgi:lactate dehydrogenase-like 2-hydroxyacid dehydrogenase